MRAAIRLGPHVFVGCLRQFLWRVLPGPLSAIKLIKRGWGLGTRLIVDWIDSLGSICATGQHWRSFLHAEAAVFHPA